jgi:hypothetical protein
VIGPNFSPRRSNEALYFANLEALVRVSKRMMTAASVACSARYPHSVVEPRVSVVGNVMLSSRAVATTDGGTSLHSPVFVVVLTGDDAGVPAADEHALASTMNPATGTSQSRERWFRTAADYSRLCAVPGRRAGPVPSWLEQAPLAERTPFAIPRGTSSHGIQPGLQRRSDESVARVTVGLPEGYFSVSAGHLTAPSVDHCQHP